MAKRTAIVVGATGFTGQFLVKQLCESEEYAAVSIITRRKPEYDHLKLDVKIKDFNRLEEEDLEIADDLFCCLGTTIKKAKTKENFQKVDLEYPLQIASLAKKRGIPNFYVISAVGSNKKSPFFYSQVKGRLEEELIELNMPSLSIFKPSLIIGGREEFRLGERVSEGLFKVLNPVFVGPLKKMRAIHGRQLAYAMYHYALYGKKSKVNIYQNIDIINARPIETTEDQPISREELFNWEKREGLFVEKEKQE
ncbi:NAD-dependent epimerase/dehydratase family protein [Psychrobacillus sp. NPDC093200]|uniref:NAD-dependent epimerase/dehydratase family protein n=1 Tax=Psychrobacillus sp. NPDC093200 TaxID=3390656 RepID=UPI003D01F98D